MWSGHDVAGAVTFRAAFVGAMASLALAAPAAGARAEEVKPANVGAVMDSVFGAGKWRETGGYRTPARENELRAQGALTVPVGVLSHHSMGRPGAPGAYDLVVEGVSPGQAAAKLRRAGAPFKRLLAEGAHGTQGPHLHLEPYGTDLRAAPAGPPLLAWSVKAATPAEQALIVLHDRSARGDAAAQLQLGQIYAAGSGAPRDPVAAFVWTAQAASNGAADEATRRDAGRALAELAGTMRPDDLALARRFVTDPAAPAGCGGAYGGGLILVIGPGPQGSCAVAKPRSSPRAKPD
jgi:hypothetical protein